jgi:DUF4097 and DUF4098 domain-containing protein YvlB
MREFECPKPITVSLRLGGGSVDITAEERSTAQVDITPWDDTDAARDSAHNAKVELHGDTLHIAAPESNAAWLWRRSARLRVRLRVPTGSQLALKVGSADIRAIGRYGDAHLNIASGDAYVEHVTGALNANAASGDLRVDRIDGQMRTNSASGDVSIGYVAGEANVHAASGDVAIGRADASLHVVTASGDIGIDRVSRGHVRVRSASGDVSIGVAAGTGVWLDLSTNSGDARSDLAMADAPSNQGGADLHLQVRTMSGDIHVRRVTTDLPAAA